MPDGTYGWSKPRWTPEEDAILEEMHPRSPNREIAARLGRTREAIQQRACDRGLTKSREQISIEHSTANVKGLPLAAGLSDAEAAYVAGIIDGEGCITVIFARGYDMQWSVTVSNTCNELIEWLIAKLGGTRSTKKRRGRSRECHAWRVSGNHRVRDLLARVGRFLVIKGGQAELAMTPHYALGPEERQALVLRLRDLNRNNRWIHNGTGKNTEGGRPNGYGR